MFAQNLVSDFFAVSAIVGSLAQHQFVGNHSHGIVVNCEGVVLATHYFRSHVARGATCVGAVVGFDDAGYSEVSGAEVAFLVEH